MGGTVRFMAVSGKDAMSAPQPEAAWQASQLSIAPLPMLQRKRLLRYPIKQVWPTAVRYLRVDRKYVITDRDQDAGYIMFEFPLNGTSKGSGHLEMIETTDASGRESVNLVVNTGAGPTYLPSSIADGLAAKILEERGQPAPFAPKAPTPPETSPPPEGGAPPMLPPAIDP